MSCFLGIDTSNYTTSASVCEDGKVILNVKIPLKVKDGACGLRQSDAVFEHIVNLPLAIEKISGYKFSAVGYSAFPRDCKGSYMPCFLSGEAVARCIASVNSIPSYRFSHQAGHITAAAYSSGKMELLEREFLAFHVSGGTTELLNVTPLGITKLGGTLDLNAGQAIDRIGLKLGLSFPCGAELEKLAHNIKSPKPKICVNGFECNLSGIENQAENMLADGISHEIVAAYTLEFIKLTIDKMTSNALTEFGELAVLYAGGVMGNSIIREYIKGKYDAYFASPEFSSDNAAGIALLCEYTYEGKRK